MVMLVLPLALALMGGWDIWDSLMIVSARLMCVFKELDVRLRASRCHVTGRQLVETIGTARVPGVHCLQAVDRKHPR
jgi:hypothetical protein